MKIKQCTICRRAVKLKDGLCPLCGIQLEEKKDIDTVETAVPDAEIPPPVEEHEDTDPGPAPEMLGLEKLAKEETEEEDGEDIDSNIQEFLDDDDFESIDDDDDGVDFEENEEDIDSSIEEFADDDDFESIDDDDDPDDNLSSNQNTAGKSDVHAEADSTRDTDGEGKSTGNPKEENSSDKKKNPLIGLPWGKILIVLIYMFAGGIFMLYEHIASEGAIINRNLRVADDILGERIGAGTTNEDMIRAAEHYLEALAHDKHIEHAHRRLDIIKRRLEERRSSLPRELAQKHISISSLAEIEKAESRSGLWSKLPVTPSERFGLTDHKRRMRHNSYIFFGILGLLIGWILLSSNFRQLSSRELRGPREDIKSSLDNPWS